jgi:hypothetical protein
MTYTKTVWVNHSEPAIDETNLNKIETGIYDANLFSVVTLVTGTYQALASDGLIVCNKISAFTVTLPTAVNGKVFSIKNIGAGTVTVDGFENDTIDGVAIQDVLQWACMKIQCTADNTWAII